MTIVPGRVVNGRVEVEDVELPEVAEVSVYLHGAHATELTAELEAEIEASLAEIARGEYIDGDDFLRELRSRRTAR
jgi:hypothetical protein